MSTHPSTAPRTRHEVNLGFANDAITAEERRMWRRIPSPLTTRVYTLDEQELLTCHADDVGEGGMHLRAPVGYGLAVGQRYEIRFDDEQPLPEYNHINGERRYATVVRTEVNINATPHEVGVGLRFDNPVFL